MKPHFSLLVLALSGCQSTEGYPIPVTLRDASTDAVVDAPGDAGSRPKLAVSGAQLLVTGPALGLQLTRANVGDDADVIAVHQEFYGIPWAAFEQGSAPPATWVALMDDLASFARGQQKAVFLSVNMLNGTRERLAATTRIASGRVETDDTASARCYDFRTAPDASAKRQAYLRYVDFMVEKFDPAYVNIAVEVNLFFEKCASAAPGLIEVANAAYDAVKAKNAARVVFPSFQIDHLYGYSEDSCPDQGGRDACFDAHYAVIRDMKRDRFAISSYPFLNGVNTPGDLPADWFVRAARRAAERALIAETGWLSTPVIAKTSAGNCVQVFDYGTAHSASYLRRVLSDASAAGMDLVTWWSDRDLLVSQAMTSCPCTFDAGWCGVIDVFRGPAPTGLVDTQLFGEILLKAFGTMGLRHYDGTPKPELMTLWSELRSRP
ncbi:MAG TPA: hypothetical protein VI072_35095 [Polyangiaceae bacterium]